MFVTTKVALVGVPCLALPILITEESNFATSSIFGTAGVVVVVVVVVVVCANTVEVSDNTATENNSLFILLV
jgi:hypothetical protein